MTSEAHPLTGGSLRAPFLLETVHLCEVHDVITIRKLCSHGAWCTRKHAARPHPKPDLQRGRVLGRYISRSFDPKFPEHTSIKSNRPTEQICSALNPIKQSKHRKRAQGRPTPKIPSHTKLLSATQAFEVAF